MSTVLSQWVSNLRIAYDRYRAVMAYSKLSDAQLLDIGLERNTIEQQVRHAMPWRERAASPARRANPSLQGCG